MLTLSAFLLLLFGCVIELTELLYDNGRVTYVAFGVILIAVGALGVVWSLVEARRPGQRHPRAEADRE